MRRKTIFMLVLTGGLLLSGCGNAAQIVETSSEKELLTETVQNSEAQTGSSEKEIQSSEVQTGLLQKEIKRFSERNMEDFAFAGEYFVDDKHHYRGEIIDEGVRNDLWNLVCSQEKESVIEEGTATIGAHSRLILTDKKTEENFYIGYDICYLSPEEDGGSGCFIITSSTGEEVYYYEVHENENIFDNLMKQGVVREENIVKQ